MQTTLVCGGGGGGGGGEIKRETTNKKHSDLYAPTFVSFSTEVYTYTHSNVISNMTSFCYVIVCFR